MVRVCHQVTRMLTSAKQQADKMLPSQFFFFFSLYRNSTRFLSCKKTWVLQNETELNFHSLTATDAVLSKKSVMPLFGEQQAHSKNTWQLIGRANFIICCDVADECDRRQRSPYLPAYCANWFKMCKSMKHD